MKETFELLPGTHRVEARQQVQFADLRGQWTTPAVTFAPIPPALTMAMDVGWPAEISEPVVDAKWFDQYGPLAGVEGSDSYTITYPDLGEYIEREQFVAADAAAGPEAIVKRLREHVAAMVQAGHLAPAHLPTGKRGYPPFFFYNPGELVATLSQTMPYLEPAQRAATLEYLRSEMAKYPPLKMSMMPMDQRARREYWYVSPDIIERQKQMAAEDYYNTWVAPENLYAVYTYVSQSEDWDYVRSHWAEASEVSRWLATVADWPTQFYIWSPTSVKNNLGTGCIADMNNHFAGLIAYARLCQRLGLKEEEQWATYLAARVATARIGLGRLAVEFELRGGLGKEAQQPQRFSQYLQVVHLNTLGPVLDAFMLQHQPSGFIHFVGINEITGPLLRQYARPELAAYMEAVTRETLWYQTRGLSQMTNSEETTNHPATPSQVFRAKAWLFEEPAEKLAGFVDIPLCKGDLFFLTQLTDVLGAGHHKVRPVPAGDVPGVKAPRVVGVMPLSVGPWRFTLDPKAQGEAGRYFAPDFDDSGWDKVIVPMSWEEQGYLTPAKGELPPAYAGVKVTDASPYNGVAWYRLKVTMPESWKGRTVYLEMGAVDDFDVTFFNGTKIGVTDKTTNPDDFWRARRVYRIPPEALRFGQENTLAVQVIDINGGGGILRRPVQLVAAQEP